ncbi:hypothetical protein Leryth_008100 [Lithospermum erythrorhizon]|nr:hypothetical protein Leryth_008100 [Lithospermum erythrorhizon]
MRNIIKRCHSDAMGKGRSCQLLLLLYRAQLPAFVWYKFFLNKAYRSLFITDNGIVKKEEDFLEDKFENLDS